MRITSTSISSLFKSQVKVIYQDESYFQSSFHFHPEFELVYISEGYGKRIIGNKLGTFIKGDLILLGANIPHILMSEKNTPAANAANPKATVIYFNPGIFSSIFFEMDETTLLKKLLAKSARGLLITGEAKKQVILKLKKLPELKGLDIIICLLDILNIISKTSELKYISQNNFEKPPSSDRLSKLFEYINTHYYRNMNLKEVSGMLNLTPGSFCRYFKQKTGKKFIDFLQETRISFACQYLLTTDLTIVEIAYKTGFKTASYFNKLFKKYTNYNPTDYRKTINNLA